MRGVVPNDHEITTPDDFLLPVAQEIRLARVGAMKVPKLRVGRHLGLHVGQHEMHEQPSETLVFRTGGAGRHRDHFSFGRGEIEEQYGAHRRRLNRRRLDPVGAEFAAFAHDDDRAHGVVLLDDALVETIGLLVGEQERRLDHGLLA